MKGAELLVRELQQRGVTFMATLCGHGLDPVDIACKRLGLRLVDVRNEQAAGYMAEVTGRLTRRVGVCAASSGVAHVNALTGVVNAYFDGAPMLLITGSGPTETMGLGHFQDLDQVALAAPVCKYAKLVDRAERIPQFLHEAFAAALVDRPGPVHLTVPLDVLEAEITPDSLVRVPESRPAPPPPSSGDEGQIAVAAGWLAQSQRPLVIAGTGLYYAEGEKSLAHLVKALSLPAVVPIWDRGTITDPIEEFMGVIGAASGGPRLLPDADLILMVGAACDYRVGYLQPPTIRYDARIIRIDGDPVKLHQGAGVHLPILGNPRVVLDQLSEACSANNMSPKSDWLREALRRNLTFREQCRKVRRPAEGRLHALDIIDAVRSVITDETILLIDGGNIGQWCHQVLCDRYPGHWLTCGASGVVGFGVPGAMAARLLYPERPIILISGDGSLGFTAAEFESAKRQGLGFVAVVADDQAWGISLTGHQRKYGEGITSELGPMDYAKMAEAFGARGIRVDRADQIVPALQQGARADRPTLIHVPIVRSNPTDT